MGLKKRPSAVLSRNDISYHPYIFRYSMVEQFIIIHFWGYVHRWFSSEPIYKRKSYIQKMDFYQKSIV